MLMATVASLYSSSPTTIPNHHYASSHYVSCSSPPVEIEFLPRTLASHHPAPRSGMGGLSSLFSSPSVRHMPSSTTDNAIDTKSMSRRSSYTDLCALLNGNEQRSSLATSPNIKEWTSTALSSSSLCNAGTSHGKPVAHHAASSVTVTESDSFPEEEQISFSQNMYYTNQGPAAAALRDLDVLDAKPGNPGLAKLKCSTLSEFFCKPLFPETFRTSGDILRNAQRQHEIFRDPFIIQAFEAAEVAHHGQFRADGDPYLVHCVETALLLASINANNRVVAAGLLHDMIDDSSLNYAELQESFGMEVSNLVEGVTKVSEFSKLARDSGTAYKSVEADRLHTMILAMTDVRVVLIKLADRLHNMRTLGALPREKRTRIAKETLEVFVPLASRLGILSWKAEMEDLCFKHLQHHEYQELASKLAEGFRESTIMSAIQKLDVALLAKGVQYTELCGRPKNLYSIYKKMIRKRRKMNEIYDLQGLRLIVSSMKDCYAALDTVHKLWPCIPGKWKDYISQPKANGYQSLHTVVQGEDGLPLEIQIRTMEMHQQAEFGVAAHWRYKEGNKPHSSFVLQMVEWARWVLTWQNEIMDTKLRLCPMDGDKVQSFCTFPFHKDECPFSNPCMRLPYCEDSPLFVITLGDGEMAVHELPGGSTIADLLQRTNEGDDMFATSGISLWEESKPRVNHKDVQDIHQRLEMGDLVELATPCISESSLSKCREKLKRMFEHGVRRKQAPSWQRLSEVAVY